MLFLLKFQYKIALSIFGLILIILKFVGCINKIATIPAEIANSSLSNCAIKTARTAAIIIFNELI